MEERSDNEQSRWPALLATIVALIGLADAAYLTIHHYTAAPVPCGAGFDCEMVLNSPYATVAGLPLAIYGAAAYFIAFSLAVFCVYGYQKLWPLFGIQAMLMAAFSGWLIYVQGALIGSFCMYCIVSAGTSVTLFIIFAASMLSARRHGSIRSS
ncbi:MAG: vitamin K epoxide reductase family protein [Chloracidobacterium sp.]|nr:vitamin K epoxide reductase family protein [Chloracidobacterium sp.]MCC6825033.1 vitamin K epoxide reductase family protein [Acidobacteriota bacterium]MCO5333325.1 vitamin K epoxide reductase family protein [Pyrinomonadaceae bacterium]